MHKNMRRSLMILYLQETWNEGYSLAIIKHIWKLRIKDSIELNRKREHQILTYNTRQGWRKEQWQ